MRFIASTFNLLRYRLEILWISVSLCSALSVDAQSPRIDFVEPASRQIHDEDALIWFDDFDEDRDYLEPDRGSPSMRFSTQVKLGTAGRSMESFYARGKRGAGGRKVIFGDTPFGRPLRRGESFDEIYWRYYVKYPVDWKGGGEAKHSRGIVFTGPRWAQASILHVWTSGNSLTLDPVRAVRDGKVLSRRYNDFETFKWLGNSPKGKFSFHRPAELGRWACIEVRWKLNTPGQSDGIAQMWVDGELDTERTEMNFRGSYDQHGINAVFLENYWNQGSPVDQYRWFDQFVVSTKPIGPVTVDHNPVVRPRLSGNATEWQLAVVDDQSQDLWLSKQHPASQAMTIDTQSGDFMNQLQSASQLPPGKVVRFRVRETVNGQNSDWSPLHWPVKVMP